VLPHRLAGDAQAHDADDALANVLLPHGLLSSTREVATSLSIPLGTEGRPTAFSALRKAALSLGL
jgi:hypothetical protein